MDCVLHMSNQNEIADPELREPTPPWCERCLVYEVEDTCELCGTNVCFRCGVVTRWGWHYCKECAPPTRLPPLPSPSEAPEVGAHVTCSIL